MTERAGTAAISFPGDAGMADSGRVAWPAGQEQSDMLPILDPGASSCSFQLVTKVSKKAPRFRTTLILMMFLASQRLEMLKYLFFQKIIDLVILKPIQKSSYNHPLQKTSSKNHPLPPPSSLLHIASILCVSIFLSFPFLPVPYPFPFPSSCFHVPSPFSFFSSLSSPILFALPCSFFPFSLFLFLRLTGKAKSCKTLMFFSKNHRKIIEQSSKIIPNPHFLDQTPFTVVRKATLQNPRVFFSKIIEKSSPTHIFWTNPPSQWSGKQKVAKPSCFFSKNHRKIIEKSSKNHPQPKFSGPTPLHSGQESKKLQNPPVFFQKIIEKSSKNLRTIIEKSSKNHPQPKFSGPTPLHSGQESKKLQNPPVVFQKIIEQSSKNHRTIFEKSSKNHPDRNPSSKNHPTNYPA